MPVNQHGALRDLIEPDRAPPGPGIIDLGCALIAGAAVVVLARPQPSTDYAGLFLAVLAAACWAGYILVNRVVGARLPGSQGPAAAAGLSAMLYVPVGIWVLASHPVTVIALGRAATAGILCSALCPGRSRAGTV